MPHLLRCYVKLHCTYVDKFILSCTSIKLLFFFTQITCPVRVPGYVRRVANPFAVATVSYTHRSVKCGRRCAERVRRAFNYNSYYSNTRSDSLTARLQFSFPSPRRWSLEVYRGNSVRFRYPVLYIN